MTTIEFPDPLSNVVSFERKKREPSLAVKRASTGVQCRHVSVFVDPEKRVLSCQHCRTLLDPFQVVLEMANRERRWLYDLEAWEAMRDSRLSDRYDEEWQKRTAEISEPPTDSELCEIWKVFHAVLGDKFCAMYKRKGSKRTGPEWYGRDVRGLTVSLEYARSRLLPTVTRGNLGKVCDPAHAGGMK